MQRHANMCMTLPMRRSQLCADRDSGFTIPPLTTARKAPAASSHSFRRHEHSRCAVPASVDFVCAARAELIVRLLVNVEQSEGPANAGVVASRSRSSAPQDRRLLSRAATGHGDRPLRRKTPVCENYVKVWLTALGHGPRNSSITGPMRSRPLRRSGAKNRVKGPIEIAK